MLFLIILVLTFAAAYFLPWWTAAIIAFTAGVICGKTSGRSFWSGFAAVFVAWAILALLKTIPNENRLATRVSHLFQLPNWILLLLVTSIIGGLVGGLAALSGGLVRDIFKKEKAKK
jgi:hypothetical protein